MKRFLTILILVLAPMVGRAQVYESLTSNVSFYSEAPFKDIEASSSTAVSYFDLSRNYILFDLMIADFEFDQGIMEQQFNDHYLESEEFPKAEFFGKVIGFDPAIEAVQEVTTMGEMTIHGVTKVVKATGRMKRDGNEILLLSRFTIDIEDFSVNTPHLFFHPVAETVDIKVEARYHLTGS